MSQGLLARRGASCGEFHTDLPDQAFRFPDPYFGIPAVERDVRIKANADRCSIDDRDFFIRGVILIPVLGQAKQFGLGVWISQKRENFQIYADNNESADIGPFFGWLSNSISFYTPDTFGLKTRAHFQGAKQRPLIELGPCDHPLYRDYAEGISLARAWEIVHFDAS